MFAAALDRTRVLLEKASPAGRSLFCWAVVCGAAQLIDRRDAGCGFQGFAAAVFRGEELDVSAIAVLRAAAAEYALRAPSDVPSPDGFADSVDALALSVADGSSVSAMRCCDAASRVFADQLSDVEGRAVRASGSVYDRPPFVMYWRYVEGLAKAVATIESRRERRRVVGEFVEAFPHTLLRAFFAD